MPKVLDILKDQATRAGVDLNLDANKAFFEALAGVDIEVPETVSNGISSKFITLADAEKYGPLKAKFKAETLDTVDKIIKGYSEDPEFPAAYRDELNSEPNTFEKLKKLVDLRNKAIQDKANAAAPDKKQFTDQIAQLNEMVRLEKEKASGLETNYKNQLAVKDREYFINDLFRPHKTIFDTVDSRIKNTTLRSALDARLQDQSAKIDRDTETGEYVLLRKDGTPYFSSANSPVSIAQFVEQTLAEQKLLAVSSGQGNPPGNPNSGANNQTGNNGGNAGGAANGRPSAAGSYNREVLKTLQNQPQ